ncbi:MAG: lysophospholipid acyltransferase family protein [Sulfitobacter sp.]
MTPSWGAGQEPPVTPIAPIGWLRVICRAVPLALLLALCLALLMLLRLFERPLFGPRRPVTPYITRFACRAGLWLIGIRFELRGAPIRSGGAMVANHASWLDIFALNVAAPVYFVSKSEVAHWPGIGPMARAVGTLFIERKANKAQAQTQQFRERLAAGHLLMFFPEGTSTDGLQVLPFKTTLFQAFFDPALGHDMAVQPISLRFIPPPGAQARLYGWWGDMSFGSHLLYVLAQPRQGAARLIYHPPLMVRDFASRKELALAAETAVRAGHADMARSDYSIK